MNDLRAIRDKLAPIYDYYFPQGWLKWLAFMIGRRPQPDFARYLIELQRLHDDAWRIVERSRVLWEELASCEIERQMKIAFQLGYDQTYYDGNVVILMYEWVKAMHENDADGSARYFRAMREFAAKGRANEPLRRRATAQLASTRG